MSRDKFKNAAGVEFANAASKSYEITNPASSRTLDADTANVAALADVVATLISDLQDLFPANFTYTAISGLGGGGKGR